MKLLLKLFRLVPLRWWIYAGAAAAIAFVLWHDHHVTKVRNQLVRENRELADEVKTAKAEAKLKEDASNAYHDDLDRQHAARGDTPTPVVSMCKQRHQLPATPGGAPAESNPGHEEAAGSNLEAGPDIGPPLYGLADERDDFIIQCNHLIDFVNATSK